MQEYPKIKVQVDWVDAGSGNLDQKIFAHSAAGTLQDTFLAGGDTPHKLARAGEMQDITPVLRSLRVNMNDVVYVPSSIQYQGKQYGMPFQLNIAALTINKTLFKRAGADLPTERTNWLQLLESLRKVARPDENVWAFQTTANMPHWMPLVWGFGGDRWTPDLKKTLLDQPAAIEGLQFYVDLMHRYRVATPLNEQGQAPSGVSRAAGNLAVSWTSGPSRHLARDVNFELDLMYHPLGPRTNKRDVHFSDQPNMVSGMAAKRGVFEQAVRFIVWLCAGKSAQELMADSLAEVPLLKSVLNSDRYLSPRPSESYVVGPPASMRITFDQIPNLRDPQIFVGWNDWHDAVRAALRPAFAGKQAVTDAAKEATRAGDLVLAKIPR